MTPDGPLEALATRQNDPSASLSSSFFFAMINHIYTQNRFDLLLYVTLLSVRANTPPSFFYLHTVGRNIKNYMAVGISFLTSIKKGSKTEINYQANFLNYHFLNCTIYTKPPESTVTKQYLFFENLFYFINVSKFSFTVHKVMIISFLIPKDSNVEIPFKLFQKINHFLLHCTGYHVHIAQGGQFRIYCLHFASYNIS